MSLHALLVLAFLLAIPSVRAQDTALRIESIPDGADIALNGKFIGTTPTTLSIEPGSFRLVIQKTGFAPWERTVELLAHSSQNVLAELRPGGPARLPSGVTAPQVLF